MFLYNLGYRWSASANTMLQGVIVNASGVDYQSAIRRETRENFPTVVLFDPQLYLCGLDVEESSRTCARLATYPFFPVEVPEFDSSEKTQREWMIDISTTVTENWPPQLPTDDEGIRSVIRSALQFQIQFGTSYIILPMPIIENPDEGIDQFVRWIDLGSIEFKELRGEIENTQIPLVTIPLSDRLLHVNAPSANVTLQGIIDHLTSRPEVLGVYLVIEKAPDSYERIISANVAWSVFHLTHILGIVQGLKVVVNFTEQLGLFALAAGATAFGSGYETKAQRCCLMDFVQRGGGGGLPHFYSLTTLCDYLPKRDILEKLVPKRLLDILSENEVPASANLFSALRADPSQRRLPPDWAEEINNVQAAQNHYIQLINTATEKLNELSSHPEKARQALTWLQRAEQNATYLNSRFEDDPLSDSGVHTRVWCQAFEQYLEEFGIS